jgi:hypothetical protein
MAFAGVTTFDSERNLVSWHALVELGEDANTSSAWESALAGNPEPTCDDGFFEKLPRSCDRTEDFVHQHGGNGSAAIAGEVVRAGDPPFL